MIHLKGMESDTHNLSSAQTKERDNEKTSLKWQGTRKRLQLIAWNKEEEKWLDISKKTTVLVLKSGNSLSDISDKTLC